LAVVSVATEGTADTAVARRICNEVGIEVVAEHGERGKQRLDKALVGYNAAARHGLWFVLRDLDRDADCAALLRKRLLATPSQGMTFRIAVHEIESWLIADHTSFARYFSVSAELVTRDPESMPHPKDHLVSVVRRSRSRQIREDVVPRDRSGVRIGPGYTSRMIDFIWSKWSPSRASTRSDSLRRCMDRLSRVR
jgi:hypothetical protein